MYKLKSEHYSKVLPLIKSHNELSVYSVIHNLMPGEIYVDNTDYPSAVLIQTSECNYLAGSIKDEQFNSSIADELDFWDQLVPDDEAWCDIIPKVHPNKHVRRYERRHYVLEPQNYNKRSQLLPNDYHLEIVDDPMQLRDMNYENSDKLLSWMENWGEDENFKKYAVASYIRHNNRIVSWSASDCCYQDKIAIGIITDDNYRGKGFGIITAAKTVELCFEHGYQQIDWLCVNSNKGSIAIAEKLGFQLQNRYYSFSSYPPIENIKDLSEEEWLNWAVYLEKAAEEEPRLQIECLYSYIKANAPSKVIEIRNMLKEPDRVSEGDINGFITYLQGFGMASHFSSNI